MIRSFARGLLGSAVLLTPLAAQSALTAPSEWSFGNSQGSYCVSYLMDPATAEKLAPKESVLAPAGRGEGLHPQVARVVRDEPEFGKWIPASVCVGFYESVSVGGEVLATMKPGKPVVFVTHTLAATSFRGAPVTAVLLGLYSDNAAVSRGLDRAGQTSGHASVVLAPVIEGRDPKTTVQLDGFKLVWEGSARGAASVLSTRTVSFGYTAQRGNGWTGAVAMTGGEGKTQYGGLGVEGKNKFAKALLASPIRAMGPLEQGGGMTLSFRVIAQK